MKADGSVDEPDPRRWLALLTRCSALFMTLLDVSVTNVALTSIGRATQAGPSQLQWVVSGYIVGVRFGPGAAAGRLGDDHGRRRMFQIGVVSFSLTSALAGLSPTAAVLIVARVLQGLAGGLINPQVSGLVQQLFRGNERGRAFGVLGTTVGVGTAIGPLVGGGLIALGGPSLGWRLVFFVNVPVGIAVIVLARRLLPADPAWGRHRSTCSGPACSARRRSACSSLRSSTTRCTTKRLAWLLVSGDPARRALPAA